MFVSERIHGRID